MDEFEVFFTFYGLILGLAAAEILNSLGGLARDGSLRAMRAQAGLIAFLTFLLICATWIDAWVCARLSRWTSAVYGRLSEQPPHTTLPRWSFFRGKAPTGATWMLILQNVKASS